MLPKIFLGGNLIGYSILGNDVAETLDLCLDYGINAIDTADVYSDGNSEKLIGNMIKKSRSTWFISTKAGMQPNESSNKLGSQKIINEKLEKSLKRLNTDYIDLYQVHNFDNKTDLFETLSTLESNKRQGKIIHYGISNFNWLQIQRLEKVVKNNSFQIVSMQVGSNILNIEKYESVKNAREHEYFSTILWRSCERNSY